MYYFNFKEKIKEILLNKFKYFNENETSNCKIAQIHTSCIESDYIFIKYCNVNELYYKIVKYNFEYFYSFYVMILTKIKKLNLILTISLEKDIFAKH